jgi:endogenous inhibitor of DNA gyrase (YacG/DUF329 family)
VTVQNLVFHPVSFTFITFQCVGCGRLISWEGKTDAREKPMATIPCPDCGTVRYLGA